MYFMNYFVRITTLKSNTHILLASNWICAERKKFLFKMPPRSLEMARPRLITPYK